uniref:CD109 molecule n=1 Tax=Macaca fascicularis TaxID=9541 RepID=Q4R6Q4_MACFA|nr:unnamed protein product [Macaca fascicularis]
MRFYSLIVHAYHLRPREYLSSFKQTRPYTSQSKK